MSTLSMRIAVVGAGAAHFNVANALSLDLMASASSPRDGSDSANLAVLGVLSAVLFLAMIILGIFHGWNWRNSMLRVIRVQKEKYDAFFTPELPVSEPIYEKDGQGIGDPKIEKTYELDAQSNRSLRTRLSRAFSLKKKIVVNKTVETWRMAPGGPFNSHSPTAEVPPMPRAPLVMEAIILPELPAQSLRTEKSKILTEDEGIEKASAERMRIDRLQSLKTEEEEIQTLLLTLQTRKTQPSKDDAPPKAPPPK
ncbi:hypothetical protein M7I_7165 [Glarea lozoyensis 74030]|uniref:Uncharacterized protein n=1 Tax=Glarea lozoyensis (strain ATCC 74030 / MF5533) TaxID=1104152 RepID=H0EWJ7_GLAL7|nr:hypothetical protein M7I_7165 [Glarea lozoyensis 74030]